MIAVKFAVWLWLLGWSGSLPVQEGFGQSAEGIAATIAGSVSQSELMVQRVLIVDSPGKKGKEFKDTTLVVSNELRLYASLYNNGKYKSEARVDWFWADTLSPNADIADSARYLGFGSSIQFKATKAAAGFIFVKNAPQQAIGDSTGLIRIVTREKLQISPISSSQSSVTQAQQNISVSFVVENLGDCSIVVQEANVQFRRSDSQVVSQQFSRYRCDSTTVIAPGQIGTFEFLVDVHPDADTGQIWLDPQLMSQEAYYDNIAPKFQWLVQAPPRLNIDRIEALVDEVAPGQDDILVVMQVSNAGGATVGDLLATLTFWHNGENVSSQYDVTMSEENPLTIAGNRHVSLQCLVRVHAEAAYGAVIINGKIAARDVNSGSWYADDGADLPAGWLVKQALLQVGIISTRVHCFHHDAFGNGLINLHQTFIVEVVVKNQGTDDLRQIGTTLTSDGESIFLTAAAQVIDLLPRFHSDTLQFHLQAQATTMPRVENFIARLDSATAITGAPATIVPAFDSLAQVKILYPAHLMLKLKPGSITAPINRIFDITAEVSHPPETSGCDSSGTLVIQLPANYGLVAGREEQSFAETSAVNWRIRAPAWPTGPDTIWVRINRRPHDKNNPADFAEIDQGVATVVATILAAYINITDVAIIEPKGAQDQILSSDQWFQVRARVQTQFVDNISIQLQALPLYPILDQPMKSLLADSACWLLRAPAETDRWRAPLCLSAYGTIQDDTTRIVAVLDSALWVQTIPRANLKVVAEIIDPPSAAHGQILPGLVFQIRGDVLNLGEAGVYGPCSLFLDVGTTANFKVLSDTIMSIDSRPAVWTIQAAEQLDAVPRILKVWLRDIPYDNNSDEEAFVSNENYVADVPVYMTPLNAQLMVRQLPNIGAKAISPGGAAKIMGIEFAYFNADPNFPMRIVGLKFDIEDNRGHLQAPQTVLAECRAINEQRVVGTTRSFSSNPIEIRLTEPIILEANQHQSVLIEGDYQEHLSRPFRLNLSHASYVEIQATVPVSIVDEFKNPVAILNICSPWPIIVNNDLHASFRNYPNPFGTPDRPRTHFIYFLSQDCDIELTIFTPIGELVYRRAFRASDPQGRRGLHQEDDLTWDGRNLKGQSVLNGVYIARIKTSTGETALSKVAFIK